MASSGETFSLQLAAFAKKAKEAAPQVLRKVSIDLLTATVLRTPVGNPALWKSKPPKGYVGGRLRANWNVSFVQPDLNATVNIDKSGQQSIDRGGSVIAQADGTQDIYIMNPLPYAVPIEYGHSGVQAPAGMVRVTVAEFQSYVDKAAASVKS